MGNKKQNNAQASLLKFRGKTKMTASTSSSSTGEKEPLEQKFLTTDTSVTHVLSMIVLRICRLVTVDVRIEKRVLILFVFIVVGGILSDFAPVVCRAIMPIRTAKESILNQYFVKIGWFWTFILTTPFIMMTSAVMSAFVKKEDAIRRHSSGMSGDDSANKNEESSHVTTLKTILSHLLSKDVRRMYVNTAVWYLTIYGFVSIERSYGSCTGSSKSSAFESCVRSGGKWNGFDISGHTFLLMFSILIMLEEMSVMIGWEPFGDYLNSQNQHYNKVLQIGSMRQFIVFDKLAVAIRINFVLMTLLTLLWHFMLIQTVLFYHTMIQKAIAGIWAAATWFLLYQGIYRIDVITSLIRPPSRPYREV